MRFRFVLTYLVASAGLTPVYDSTHYPDFLKDIAGIFPGKVSGDAKADLPQCIAFARQGALTQLHAEMSLCCMLVNTAVASISDADWDKLWPKPEFPLLRHMRKAASHGNTWSFRDKGTKEPQLPTKWHTLELDHTKQGNANPLQGKQCFYGTIQPTDLLYLLRDVDRLFQGFEWSLLPMIRGAAYAGRIISMHRAAIIRNR